MSDATVEITLHNMTADPMNVMNAPLSHGSWKNNPVGAIINVDRQHDFYAIDGTAQIQGELELDWGYKGKVTVSFHIDGDQLKYKATMEPNGVKTEKVSKTGPNAFHLTVEFI